MAAHQMQRHLFDKHTLPPFVAVGLEENTVGGGQLRLEPRGDACQKTHTQFRTFRDADDFFREFFDRHVRGFSVLPECTVREERTAADVQPSKRQPFQRRDAHF